LTYDAAGDVVQNNENSYDYDSERRVVNVRNGIVVQEHNIYDWRGQRVTRWTLALDTTFIDGLYQTDIGETLRHVPMLGAVVATISTPGAALPVAMATIPLLDESRAVLASFSQSAHGDLVRAGIWNPRWDGPASRWSTLMAVLLALLAGATKLRAIDWRRPWKALWAHVRGVVQAFARSPFRWAVGALLVATHICQVNQPALAQLIPLIPQFADASAFYYHYDEVGNTNIMTNEFGEVSAGAALGAIIGLATGALGSIFGLATNPQAAIPEVQGSQAGTAGTSAALQTGTSAVTQASVNTALAFVHLTASAAATYGISVIVVSGWFGLGGAMAELGLQWGPLGGTTPGVVNPFSGL
jgi:hypothetical protein